MSSMMTLLPTWGSNGRWKAAHINANDLALTVELNSGEEHHTVSFHYGLGRPDAVLGRVDLFEILGEMRLALVDDDDPELRHAIVLEIMKRNKDREEVTTG